jgi:hypothetical protein
MVQLLKLEKEKLEKEMMSRRTTVDTLLSKIGSMSRAESEAQRRKIASLNRQIQSRYALWYAPANMINIIAHILSLKTNSVDQTMCSALDDFLRLLHHLANQNAELF